MSFFQQNWILVEQREMAEWYETKFHKRFWMQGAMSSFGHGLKLGYLSVTNAILTINQTKY